MNHRRKINYSRFDHFQEAIAEGRPNDWRLPRRVEVPRLYLRETDWCTNCLSSAGIRACRWPVHDSGRKARVSDREKLLA